MLRQLFPRPHLRLLGFRVPPSFISFSTGKPGSKPRAAALVGSGEDDASAAPLLPLFRDALDINPLTRQALTEVLFDDDARMTDVQAATLLPGLRGDDILARARTGTGKTVAFLVPALQNVTGASRNDGGRSGGGRNGGGAHVEVLCVSPTRELATQISTQTETLLSCHPRATRPAVQTLFGGSRKPRTDTNMFMQDRPRVLVATPGRLLAHLEDRTLGADPLASLKVLVLGESMTCTLYTPFIAVYVHLVHQYAPVIHAYTCIYTPLNTSKHL